MPPNGNLPGTRQYRGPVETLAVSQSECLRQSTQCDSRTKASKTHGQRSPHAWPPRSILA
eukprot:289523-Lingulodinium_polyedra.AAC.1